MHYLWYYGHFAVNFRSLNFWRILQQFAKVSTIKVFHYTVNSSLDVDKWGSILYNKQTRNKQKFKTGVGIAIKSKETSSKLAIYTVAVHANTFLSG